jgi:hypothetical protein
MTSDNAYELKVDLPEGDPIQIPGLGTFDTGKTYEISQEEANGYREYWKRNGQLGPTLLQASKKMHRIVVTTVGKSEQDNDKEPENKPADEGSDKGKDTEGGAQ